MHPDPSDPRYKAIRLHRDEFLAHSLPNASGFRRNFITDGEDVVISYKELLDISQEVSRLISNAILLWDFEEKQSGDDQLLEEHGAGSASTGGAADPKAISFVGHQKQFEDFVAAINEGRDPQIDGYEGRKSVELILAIYQSSWEGKRIDLPLQSDPQRPE